ncbi:MAG: 30S ribosomal protein S20 [Candidatus Saccharimonadales bacterium]
MPIIKSAIKRAKQALVHKERNQATKRDIKSAVKAFEAKPSATTLSAAHGAIDTAVKKNILEKRTAARRKASLSKRAQEAGVKLASAKPAAKSAAKPAAKPKAAVKKPTAKKATATK